MFPVQVIPLNDDHPLGGDLAFGGDLPRRCTLSTVIFSRGDLSSGTDLILAGVFLAVIFLLAVSSQW